MKQYHIKKGIEKELDDMDYWHEQMDEPTGPGSDYDTVIVRNTVT